MSVMKVSQELIVQPSKPLANSIARLTVSVRLTATVFAPVAASRHTQEIRARFSMDLVALKVVVVLEGATLDSVIVHPVSLEKRAL